MLLLWYLYFLPHHQATLFSSPAFSLDCIICHSTTLVKTLASTAYLPVFIVHPLRQANLRYDQQSTFSMPASEQSHWVVENHRTGQMEITTNSWPPTARGPSTPQGSSLYYYVWKVISCFSALLKTTTLLLSAKDFISFFRMITEVISKSSLIYC